MRKAILVFVAVLAMATVASAQDKPVTVNIGGGPTFTLSDTGDNFNMGWGPAIGVTINADEHVGFGVEYAYRRFYVKDSIDAAIGRLDAFQSSHQLDFNFVGTLAPSDAVVKPFIVAGPGMYYRSVSVTQYQGTGVVCDPWLYLCGSYPIEAIIGTRGGWDFGFNVGGGVGFQFEGVQFYIESRYHYVWGPEFTRASTMPATAANLGSGKANGTYLPLTFGFKF